MRVAIIDADLIGRTKHRFPNLACMKISSWHKLKGADVVLKTNYEEIEKYDKVFISKVFTDTPVPKTVLSLPNVEYGGTGFFYDKSPMLPNDIEHCMPDYHLYDDWVNEQILNGGKRKDYKYYLDYSIGFLTRGCFRQCEFCVNKNYKRVEQHSPLTEFLDLSRKKICLLDDNFFGCPNWKQMLNELNQTGKPFQFKQGLDERLLNDEKCQMLFNSKYDGDYIFAFDNIEDKNIIIEKLHIIRKYTDKWIKFYVFTGFDRNNKWDLEFWKQDLKDLWERIEILMEFRCLPYVMRFNRYEESPYRSEYIYVAAWTNQPSMFKKKSYKEYAELRKEVGRKAAIDSIAITEKDIPELERFHNIKVS